eukprot:5206690-Pleurochrysis_carterae.AAC.1
MMLCVVLQRQWQSNTLLINTLSQGVLPKHSASTMWHRAHQLTQLLLKCAHVWTREDSWPPVRLEKTHPYATRLAGRT